LAAETPPPDEEAEDEAPPIDTRAVLDLFAEELGTGVQATLTLYLRVTALYRLLAQSPSLAALAIDPEEPGGTFTENALLAAARLDLNVTRRGADGAADFDPRQFRAALDRALDRPIPRRRARRARAADRYAAAASAAAPRRP